MTTELKTNIGISESTGDQASPVGPELKEQAAHLLSQAAGLVGSRVIEIGLEHGLLEAASRYGEFSPPDLASATGIDPFYSEVWCRGAFAAGVLDSPEEGSYRLAAHMGTLLLDKEAPTFAGGLFTIMEQPEIFRSFSANLASGKRTWWSETSNDFIHAVADTGGAFNNRFVPDGMVKVPGVAAIAHFGGRMLELASGTGYGLIRAARSFPAMTFVGVDGDAYSLEVAREKIAAAGLTDRIELVHSTLEDFDAEEQFDLISINVSMHECRDIEGVTASVYRALKPGGYFLNSDFPFPSSPETLRSVPGRIMSGIQFFEAQIDDQLLTVDFYLDLLTRHGFEDVGVVELTPVHAITHGRK